MDEGMMDDSSLVSRPSSLPFGMRQARFCQNCFFTTDLAKAGFFYKLSTCGEGILPLFPTAGKTCLPAGKVPAGPKAGTASPQSIYQPLGKEVNDE